MSKIAYIDPIIGTVGNVSGYEHGGGKTHPGACTPGGMVQFSPDTITGNDNGTGYNYLSETIEGFSVNHLSGIGWHGDLGNLQMMPVVGACGYRSGTNQYAPLKKTDLGWNSPFSHEKENATPGYYSVFLDRYQILAEMTVAPRSGILRLTYPKAKDAGVLFNLSRRIGGHADLQYVNIVDNRHIEGWIKCTPAGGGFGLGRGGIRYTLYFTCEFSKDAESFEFFSNEEPLPFAQSMEGEDLGLVARFSTEEREQILLRLGLSYVDIEGARKNLAAEVTGFDFDALKAGAEALWEQAMEIADVEGSDETDKTLFYSCLYHTLLDPRIAADVDGRYPNADGSISQSGDYTRRTVFSGWDVYRSEFPLLTLVRPDVVNDEINSLIQVAEAANSSLPRWELLGVESGCMVGDPGVIITADAYVKGIRNFDAEKAYRIARAGCLGDKELDGKPFHPIRVEADDLNRLGFVPRSLSRTLEDLFADYTLSRFAEALGKKEDQELFEERSKWYVKSFNRATGYMGVRDEEGNFLVARDIYDTTGCTESNIIQQSWFVPHDTPGLVALFGAQRFESTLEGFFARADFTKLWNDDYNHSNEPCHHNAYLFHYVDRPDRTQYWVRRIQKEAYRLGAFGFCGNEDVGQISAWYVLSALGFGQPCLAVPHYYMNTPLFQKASIRLDEKYHACGVDDRFTVVCNADPLEKPYIKALALNGEKLDRLYLTYDEITNGGVLEISLKKEA